MALVGLLFWKGKIFKTQQTFSKDKMEKYKKIFFALLVSLVILSFLTRYYGSIDSDEYLGVAKFFAKEYNAKIRVSHSIAYGLIHAPLIKIFPDILIMKLTSLIWLILIIFSLYYISNKNKKTIFLFILSPIIWYIAPWINPIQLASLLFLWAFFFINKYEKNEKIKYLFYSGIFIGFSWIFWNTVLFILFFFIICFFYNKNINHLFVFIISVFAGLSPLLLLDQIFYGSPFYSITKHFIANIVVFFYGSIYPAVDYLKGRICNYISFLLLMPVFFYTLFNKKFFSVGKRQIIFLVLSFLFFLTNPQLRYILFLWPILTLYLSKSLNEKQFKTQLIIFSIISFLVIIPYIIQIKYSTNAVDLTTAISNFGSWSISSINQDKLILEGLKEIVEAYPNSVFVIGNAPDDYAYLANIYSGNGVKEFVSIQDYELYLNNESVLFEKKIILRPKIRDRREIWIGGGMNKNMNDDTDYGSIKLALGLNEPIKLDNFKLVKKYGLLYLSEKTEKEKK